VLCPLVLSASRARRGCWWSALSGGRSSLPYELGERLYVKDRRGMVRDVQILDSQRFKLGKAFPMQGLV